MDTTATTLENLFAQLGLANSTKAIEDFIQTHQLTEDTNIAKAPYWNEAQASFINEALRNDAEWCEVIDQLNAQLHQVAAQ
ncbi:DUF2789 domain-containing protein [Alishewanella sp. 16-MA]|uniref:DUF2789 domain-containing protein n=1 Tax=Alishewanella maricola TaxID=2795740 RepID=A0ABS8C0D3_9ALTE|nr:DUF2789 domain-containing protein [Alishewanella maricola]MCB5225628.1 DUF2789 domain-containing protein [Alishewanella maricola]